MVGRRLPDEQVSTLTPLGITDMDGDGKHDLVVSRNTGEQNYVHIYSANLEEMAIIPTPLSRRAGFADADQDGYPELYIADETTGLSVTVIEYQRTSSHIDGFERLR